MTTNAPHTNPTPLTPEKISALIGLPLDLLTPEFGNWWEIHDSQNNPIGFFVQLLDEPTEAAVLHAFEVPAMIVLDKIDDDVTIELAPSVISIYTFGQLTYLLHPIY